MKPERIQKDRIEERLLEAPEWEWDEDQETIRRKFRFFDFQDATAFADHAAVIADHFGHVPTSIDIRNQKLTVLLGGPDRGLTETDFDFAVALDSVY